jgi:hypothetical protein
MADGWYDETPAGGWSWETAAPGPDLAAAIADADPESLPGEARVSLLRACDRLVGWANVRAAAATVAVADAVVAETARIPAAAGRRQEGWVGEEVAAALRLAPGTALGRVATARSLVDRWPALGENVAGGALTWTQAVVLAEGVAVLDGRCDDRGCDLSEVAVERLLPTAGQFPPARLRARVAAQVLVLDPDAAARRRRRTARETTDVGLWAEPEGMGCVYVRGTAPDAVAVRDVVAQRAREMRAMADDPAARTVGQWRVAALMGALGLTPVGMPPAGPAAAPASSSARQDDGTAPACPQPGVQVRVTIDLATLLGLADAPADLDGYGPIDPDLARALAADADWVRWVTDPVTGYLLDAGTRRYPGARLSSFVRGREARCAHPVCGVRSPRCDVDHVPEYRSSGRTTAAQLTATCPRHNRGRDGSGWTVDADPEYPDPYAGPQPTWTTLLGRRYRSLTAAVLPFTPVAPGLAPPEEAVATWETDAPWELAPP